MERIRSKPGLDQSEALISLQRLARKKNALITTFIRQNDRWVASLRPLAEFPPEDDDDEAPAKPPMGDGPDDSDDDSTSDNPFAKKDDEGSDGPPDMHKDKPEHGGSEHEILDMLHKVLEGLQNAGLVDKGPSDDKLPSGDGADDFPPPPPGPGGPPGMGGPAGPPHPPKPSGPPMPPPGGGAPGGAPGMPPGPKGQPYGTKLKPGEVPNRPGVVPVGAPSFASVKTADSPYSWSPADTAGAPDVNSGPMMGMTDDAGNPGGVANPPCSKCGGPTMGGICPRCAQGAGGSGNGSMGVGVPGTLASVFHIQSPVGVDVQSAQKQLNKAYGSYYKIAKIDSLEDGTLLAELRLK